VLWLRMHGAIPQLSSTSSLWCIVKHSMCPHGILL